jgi:hypothetical protein
MRGGFYKTAAKDLLGVAFAVAVALACTTSSVGAGTLRVTWASSPEGDLAGYRLRYGTSPGVYSQSIDTGQTEMCLVPGLDAELVYYFAVSAYDFSGNESEPSEEITARIPASLAPIPVVSSAIESSTQSMFAVRARSSLVMVYGANLEPGATVSFGPGVNVGSAAHTALGNMLVMNVDVDASASPGSRTATVTNADQGIGSRSDLLTIVKSPDINGDCTVDVLDLNVLARSWNETENETQFVSGADFNGDGYVGPDDLTVFVQYFGRALTGCP